MLTSKWKLLGSIFVTFLKMSPVTFGGGYVLIPVIEREIAEKREWLRSDEVTDIVAVSGSIPGAVAINSATFIGYRIAGVSGAIAALLGILLPAFMIVMALSVFYLQVKHEPKIEAAFMAIRPTIVALIVYAAIKTWKTAAVDRTSVLLIIATVLLMWFGRSFVHPVLLLAGGAAVGMVAFKVRAMLGKETKVKKEEHVVYDYMI